ncbi:MAG: hypothetical protein PHQ35_10395 [Phycisphaerae bacterium]|nr:hypothetical protein [Phycisphaerae bacterium]MDD5381118.1 hypothetical protein [Phycisphaerae bacterium]
MNKKQIIIMWLGIATITFYAFVSVFDTRHPDYADFSVWVFIVVLVTSGLIYTLRDKKGQENKDIRKINLKHGFRRITFVLAIIAAFIGFSTAVGTIIDEYNFYNWKPKGTVLVEAGEQKQKPDVFDRLAEPNKKPHLVLDEPVTELKKPKGCFWVNLSKGSLIGLCTLAGLGGAAVSFGGIWLVYLLVFRVCQFIRWLVMGFYDINQSR